MRKFTTYVSFLLLCAVADAADPNERADQPPLHPAGVVEAQKFVLKDEDGSVRAEIGIRRGGPHISLLNPDGSVGASLNLERTGRGLVIVGPNGQEQIAMGKASGQSNYYLTIKSSDGNQLFSIPTTTPQNPSENSSSWLIAVAIVIAGPMNPDSLT